VGYRYSADLGLLQSFETARRCSVRGI